MAAPRTKIPNDISNEVFYAAVEAAPGVVPTSGWFRFNGQPDINSTPTIIDEQDTTGTFVRKNNPAKGMTQHAGTWGGTASYERLPSVLRAVLQSGDPVTGSSPAYTRVQDAAMLYDDADTYSIIHNVLGDLYQARGVRYGNFNIAGSLTDANSMWTYGGDLQMVENDQLPIELFGPITSATPTVLTMTGAALTIDELIGAWIYPNPDSNLAGGWEIIDNDATTITVGTPFDVTPTAGDTFLISGLPPAGVAALVEEKIRFPGTKLFIDPTGDPLGTTQILKRFIGFNVSANLNLDPKDFAEDVDSHSGVFGRGELLISGQVRLEADRPDEFRQLKALTELGIRIEQLGTELSPGVRKMAQIDLPRLMWTQRTKDTRNNNKTQTMAFWGYYHVPVLRVTTRNGLAALP